MSKTRKRKPTAPEGLQPLQPVELQPLQPMDLQPMEGITLHKTIPKKRRLRRIGSQRRYGLRGMIPALFLSLAWASNAHSQGHGSLARIGGFSGGEGYGDYWDAQRKQLQASAARAAVVTRTPEEWRRIYEKQAQLVQAAASQREAEQKQAREQERLKQLADAELDEEIAALEKNIAAEKRWMRERAILVARIAKRNAEDAAFELNQQNTWPQWFKRLSLPAFFGVGLVTAAAHFWSATFKALQRWLLARQIAR